LQALNWLNCRLRELWKSLACGGGYWAFCSHWYMQINSLSLRFVFLQEEHTFSWAGLANQSPTGFPLRLLLLLHTRYLQVNKLVSILCWCFPFWGGGAKIYRVLSFNIIISYVRLLFFLLSLLQAHGQFEWVGGRRGVLRVEEAVMALFSLISNTYAHLLTTTCFHIPTSVYYIFVLILHIRFPVLSTSFPVIVRVDIGVWYSLPQETEGVMNQAISLGMT
jgi:hypothetical protein